VTPRLLLNENFPAPATADLRAAGLDIVAVSECCSGWDDVRVMALAVEEQRWLITFDRDYGELVYLRGLTPPPAIRHLILRGFRKARPTARAKHFRRPCFVRAMGWSASKLGSTGGVGSPNT
jgi:hypothetical protein